MNKSKWFIACLVVIALALAFLSAPNGRLSRTRSARQQAVQTTNGLSAANPPGPAKPASAPAATQFNAQSGAAQNTNSLVVAAPFQGRQPVNAGSAFSEFGVWSQRYMAAPTAADKALLEAEGVALAKARREALSILIKSNPRRALGLAAPWKIRNALPASIATQLEEQVSGRGNFKVFAADTWPGQTVGKLGITRQINVKTKLYDAYVYGRRLHQVTTPNAALFGIAVDTDMAVHEDPVRVLEREEAQALLNAGQRSSNTACAVCGRRSTSRPEETLLDYGGQTLSVCSVSHAIVLNQRLAAAEGALTLPDGGIISTNGSPISSSLTQGTKTLLFMRVNFADDLIEPITEAEATDLMNQVNAYFVEASYNTTAIISTVTPLLQLPQTKLWYGTNGPGTLQADARLAAKAVGYNYVNYDLDIVRHSSVPGFNWGGLAAVGGRGVWLQATGVGVAAHELGHNYGLFHANSWNTVRPPWTTNNPPNPSNLPFDPDSLLGHDSVIGPGTDAEYGDSFDIMGSGGGHYNAVAKNHLHWMPDPYVRTVISNGTYRVYAMDTPLLTYGRSYALKVRKDFERDYWADYRSQISNPWLQNGIELHWNSWSQTGGGSQLLDTTPGTASGKQDAALVIGRTFTDPSANLHLTPVAKGGSAPDAWIDVVVNIASVPTNLPPTISINATADRTGTNTFVDFVATANDLNGDALAYYWDFGDSTFGGNSSSVSKSWNTEGEYVVRCEVSDMKGGLASAYIVITVGSPGTFRVSGRVMDNLGNPLPGVRVHNGAVGTNGLYSPDYRWTSTDSQGNYTLVNLAPGTYTNAAFLFGYRIEPLDFFNPVNLVGADATGIDYLATPLPTVGIVPSGAASEAVPNSARFTVTRIGPTNAAQTVLFQVSGTAPLGSKYTIPTNSLTLTNVGLNEGFGQLVTNLYEFYSVTIPAGAASTDIVVNPVNETAYEGTQTVTLTLALPVQSLAFLNDTNITNSVYVPGWEVVPVDLKPTWFQTYPDYALADGSAEATLAIRDDDAPTSPLVSILALDDVATESGQDVGLFALTRFGAVDNPLTILFAVSGSAVSGIDYVPLPDSVTIPAGQSFVNLPVRAIQNLYVEPNQTVIVTLATNSAYRVGTDSASVTIVDDNLPIVTIDAPAPTAREAGRNGAFVVTRIGDLSEDLQVSYLVGGTAISGRDYVPLSGSVVIPAGSVSVPITVTPVDNQTTEGDLTVVAYLSDTPIYNVGSPRSATVTIQDKNLPTVTIAATVDPAVEPSTVGQFTVTRAGSIANNLVVNFITGGSAIPGSDYAAIGGKVTVPAGTNSANITITPVENNYREEPETVILQLTTNSTYNLGSQYQALLTLNDGDSGALPAVGFTRTSSSGPESLSSPVIAVEISADPDAAASPVTVDYRVIGGTAISNVDYKLTGTGSLIFTNSGPRIQDLPLTIVDNTVAQPNRTIIIGLFDPGPVVTNVVDTNTMTTNMMIIPTPTNAFLDVYRTYIYTILDDDVGVVSIQATDPIARETGPEPGTFTITRTGNTAQPLTVNIQVTGTATSGSDFVPIGTSVTIPAGANSLNIPVVPLDNPTQDRPETVKVTLLSAPGGKIGSPDNATVTILDNDGTIEFTAANFGVNEKAGYATITVQRTGDTNSAVNVDYATSNGTATAGLDYVETNGTLSFGPGETVKTFLVPIIDDTLVEANETINLILQNPTGGTPLGGQNKAVLTIFDDDTALEFAASTFTANENGTNAAITVRRIGVSTNKVTVDYATSDGTATAGLKYVAQTGTLYFSAGETEQTFTVPIIDNALTDGNESVNLALANPTGGVTLAGQSNAVLVIGDDECSLQFDVASYSVIEYAGTVTLNVRRIGGTVNPVKVDYLTGDGTAKAGVKYVAQNGTLSFAGDAYVHSTNGTGTLVFRPGETNTTITIALIDEQLGEGDQTFNVYLTNALGPQSGVLPGSVTLGQITNAIVTIVDDETPGNVDYEFNPGAVDGRVRSVALQPDQTIIFGGEFTTVNGINFNRVARLHPDGNLDSGFNPGAGSDDAVMSVASQSDGKVLLGGAFLNFDATSRNHLARLNADGSLDFGFDSGSGPNGLVRAIATQADGKVLVGGDFTSINGTAAGHLARLSTDGSLDPDFNVGFGANDAVYAITVQTNGRVLVAGKFTGFNGGNLSRIARLNPDGSLDNSFNPGSGANGSVYSVAQQADGRILIAGTFTSVNGVGSTNVARLGPDGSVDRGFNAAWGADDAVYSVAVAADGKIFVGGAFTHLNGANLNRFARLNTDGSLDPSFDPGAGANGTVYSVVAQPDGAWLIGGEFTQVNGLAREGIARIHGEEKFTFGIVQFSGATYQVSEKAGVAVITVVRTGNIQTEFSVDYLTSDGTAKAGTKYVAQNGTLSFASGETAKTFTIPIIDETTAEGNETVNLILTNAAAGASLGGRATAVLVIVDDESAVSFALPNYTLKEDAGAATIEVTRTGGANSVVTVDYATTDGTATAGLDYLAQRGTLSFGIGETNKTFTVPITDDSLTESNETIILTLSNPTGGVMVGTQGTSLLTVLDNDELPRFYNLNIERPLGGTVSPPSGQYPTNSIQVLIAAPERNYEFAGWEGSVSSTKDPLILTMNQNYNLTANFRLNSYSDTFESGGLSTLPWSTAGDQPWSVASGTASGGRFAARSGLIEDGQQSSLALTFSARAGTGSFDFRVSSEAGWDFLEFYLNGVRVQRWSGDVNWQTFQFAVPAGYNTCEWRYAKDANFSAGLDSAFIDNVFIPLNLPDNTNPAALLSVFGLPTGPSLIRLQGQADRSYVIEASTDLVNWNAISTNVVTSGTMFLEDLQATNYPLRFYRAVAW